MRLVFDRGTLVLQQPPPRLAVSRLSGVLWDPRVQAYRAPGWYYSALVRQLRGAGVSFADEVATHPTSPRGCWKPLGLRPYQQAAVLAWELSGRRGIVALPTGSGKTRIGLAAMAAAPGGALCLVPTRVLLHQWLDQLQSVYSGPIGRWGDGERSRAPLSVATFESAYRHMARIGADFELLVIDEAHHFGGGMRDEALEMAVAPARLGLTATPPDPGPGADRLAELVGPVVHELAIADLAGRYLADFDVVVLTLPLDEVERRRYEADDAIWRSAFRLYLRSNWGADWKDFMCAASRSRDGRAALQAWRRARRLLALTHAKDEAVGVLLERHREQRVLVFTSDNASAYALARTHLLMPLTCDIKRQEREQVLSRFRSGALGGLISSRVLNEGLDVPDADIAIVVGGSLGGREHVQRVGRLLRPARGKRALVYELVAAGTTETKQGARRRRNLGRKAIHAAV